MPNAEFGPYRPDKLIAGGTFAGVYTLQDSDELVIKVLPQWLSDDGSFAGRFDRQMEFVSQLEHPNILRPYDYGVSNGFAFVVLPYLSDGNLADRLDAGEAFTISQSLDLLDELAAALAAIHTSGMVHGDVKPDNIFLDRTGKLQLTDLGLASVLRETLHLLGRDQVVGDPRYLAPEVWQGEAVQATTDVYASGILAYRLLTGAYPFNVDADARDAAQMAHHAATPAPTSGKNPELPEAVDPVLQRALARHPGQRFRSGRDLATALREAITGEVSPENQSSPVDYTDQPTNRSPVWWLKRIGCTMLLGIWLVLIVFTCLMVTVLAQGEATFDFSDRPGHAIRVFDVQSEDKRGLGLSIGRLEEEDDDRACIRTTVRYLMWEGSNEPTDYCECYNRADGEWYRGPEVDADCNPVAD